VGGQAVSEQNIIATLELSDHEIRLAIGQFFNKRLSILKVERVVCGGVLGQMIQDPHGLSEALRKACDHVTKTLGTPLQRVVLALPSVSMHRFNQKVSVDTQGTLTLSDVQRGLRQVLKTPLPEHLEIINVIINKTTVNGISLRRLPLDEACSSFTLDVDLLCADKDLVYQYASVVEKAGLEIQDVSLDHYAIGKEASLFERSMDRMQVLIKIERQSTSLSLFARGKLMSTEVLPIGSGHLVAALAEKHRLPVAVADRLLHHNVRLGLPKYPKTPIYLWSADEKNYTLTEHDVALTIDPPLDAWLQLIHKTISPILNEHHPELALAGESADINGLATIVSTQMGCPTTVVVSETLGLRQAALSTVAGLFYVMKDQVPTRELQASLDMDLFSAKIKSSLRQPNPEDTLGNKFKTLFTK
jgi:cell division protein FtsA